MEIRLANYSEKNEILNFIDKNWQRNHIFVRWPELFDDYHKNGDMLNYMVAVEQGKIYGVCGFIYANNGGEPDIWLALWKVIPSGIPSLGMDIVNTLKKTLNCNVLSCCGIRKEVKRLYEFLGFKTGTLKHFYRLNKKCKCRIAVVLNTEIPDYIVSNDIELVLIHSENDFNNIIEYERAIFQATAPWKDRNYVIKKYFYNLAYTYQLFAVKTSRGTVDAIFVTKIVEANYSRAMRIVDFLGDETVLRLCGKSLERLMEDNECEYIDFYEYGLSDDFLRDMGMKELNETDTNIIPNHFEPFEQNNIDIHFFTSQIDNFRMFKADGDQERPNRICRGKYE
ncbi:hypothetical protein AALB47_20145 [Lachnospiraceae bacterium 54-11]